jgi:Ca2+-transporting ATPase
MGFATFALMHVFFAITTKDERRSIFNLDTFADKPLLISIGASILAILLQSSLSPLQRLLDTTDLNIEQWGICLGSALLIVVVSEVRKLLYKQPLDEVVSRAASD